jgi:hypothetical protein
VLKVEIQRVFLPAVVSLLLAAPLHAQDFLNHLTVGAGAGFSFPIDEIAAHTKTGFNFVASGGPRLNPRFSVGLDFSLHYLNVKNSLQSPETGVDLSLGSMMRMWSLTLNPVYEFIKQDRFSSYATGGYGLYNRRLLLSAPGLIPAVVCDPFWNVCVSNTPSGAVVTGSLGVYKGGYNAGGGVNFGARAKFFTEVRYHHMFTQDAATQIIPLTFGIRW